MVLHFIVQQIWKSKIKFEMNYLKFELSSEMMNFFNQHQLNI